MDYYIAGIIIPKFVVDAGREEVYKAVKGILLPFGESFKSESKKVKLSEEELDMILSLYNVDADNIKEILIRIRGHFNSHIASYDSEGFYYQKAYNPHEKFAIYSPILEVISIDDYLETFDFIPSDIAAIVSPLSDWMDKTNLSHDEWKSKLRHALYCFKGNYLQKVVCYR